MKIVLLRIDERLIHGQITMSWTRTVNANLILCINDEVSKNTFQKNLMKMAGPPGVTVEIQNVDEAAENLNKEAWPNANILLMVRNPIDLLRLIDKGLQVTKINVGGVRSPEAKIKLTKEVSATPEELVAWKKLDELGIRMENQFIPTVGITNLNEVIRKQK